MCRNLPECSALWGWMPGIRIKFDCNPLGLSGIEIYEFLVFVVDFLGINLIEIVVIHCVFSVYFVD